jgi:hypothetical protein
MEKLGWWARREKEISAFIFIGPFRSVYALPGDDRKVPDLKK